MKNQKSEILAFYLLTYKGYYVLKSLIDHCNTRLVKFVVVGRDKNLTNDYADSIIKLCKDKNILCYERNDKIVDSAQYAFAIGWRWLISENNTKLIVLHDSLLPKYRGFAPLVNCLINGENEVGVTALLASKEYDRGDIISQKKISIKYPIKIKLAIEMIVPLYFKLVQEITETLSHNKALVLQKQNEKNASYSVWRDDEDYIIDWNKDAGFLQRFIDAVGEPYAGACSTIKNRKVRILDAKPLLDVKIENRNPGKVIFMEEGIPTVICGTGLLQIISMIYDDNGEPAIPLKNFRIRFK